MAMVFEHVCLFATACTSHNKEHLAFVPLGVLDVSTMSMMAYTVTACKLHTTSPILLYFRKGF